MCSAPIEAAGDGVLPTSILLFRPGENHTSKGVFVFDEKAAVAVMQAYARGGVDVMIDREHDSLDPQARAFRADAADAMGWGKLAVRADGSLWLDDVSWGAEGEKRLREKRSRYISPAFITDKENRVIEITNVAIVAAPATFHTPALIAASQSFPASQRARAYLALERMKNGSRKSQSRT